MQDEIEQTRKGSLKALAERVNRLFPTRKVEEKEYKGDVFVIGLPKGGEFNDDFEILRFTSQAIIGDVRSPLISALGQPIRFYAKVIGLEDINAPRRNWGMSWGKFCDYWMEGKHSSWERFFLNIKKQIKARVAQW